MEDWAPPPAPVRPAGRLFLPGEECAYKVVSGVLPVPGATTTTTIEPPPPETYPPTIDPDTGETILHLLAKEGKMEILHNLLEDSRVEKDLVRALLKQVQPIT